MVRWISIWQCGGILPLGRNLPLQEALSGSTDFPTELLDQYKQ